MKKMLKRLISMGVAAVMTVMCAAALSVPVFADESSDVFTYLNFEEYEVGKTITDLANGQLHPSYVYANGTGKSKIVNDSDQSRGKVLNILPSDDGFSQIILNSGNNVNINQTKNMIELDLMFKADSKASMNIILIATDTATGKEGEIKVAEIKRLIKDGKISPDTWYTFSAKAYKNEGIVTTEIKDQSGVTVYKGNNINSDLAKKIKGYTIMSFKDDTTGYSQNLFVDEIKMFQADEEMTVPPETKLFTEDFESYDHTKTFSDEAYTKNKKWYPPNMGSGSNFVEDEGSVSGRKEDNWVLNVGPTEKNNPADRMFFVNMNEIKPTMNMVVLSVWFRVGEKDHIAINLRTKNTDLNNTSNGTNLIVIQEKKVAGTKDTTIQADKWYNFVSEINTSTNKMSNTITDQSGNQVFSVTDKNLSGAENFCGVAFVHLKNSEGKYGTIRYDDIIITQKCGTPAIDGTKDIKFITPDGKEATETANVSAATNTIELNFTTPMNLTSLQNSVTIKAKNGENVGYSGKLSKDYKTYIMTLNDVLSTETEYAVKVGSGVKAYTGESIERENTIDFTTAKGEMTGTFKSVKIGGNDVTAVSQLTTGTTMDITIDYVNTLGTEELNGYVIVAYFNGNKLIKADYGAKIERAADVKSEIIKLERAVPDFGTEILTSAKLMFWNGLDKMIPITDAYPIPNSSTNQ